MSSHIDREKIAKARKWAAWATSLEGLGDDTWAATQVIAALPDTIVDGEKLSLFIDQWSGNPFPSDNERDMMNHLTTLLTPPLPTLAELIEQGHDPDEYQWMWADTEDGLEIIIMAGDFEDEQVYTLDQRGYRYARNWSEVTPLPGEPRLKWPSPEPAEGTHYDDLPEHVKEILTMGIEDMEAGRFVDIDLGEETPAEQASKTPTIELIRRNKERCIDSQNFDGAMLWRDMELAAARGIWGDIVSRVEKLTTLIPEAGN